MVDILAEIIMTQPESGFAVVPTRRGRIRQTMEPQQSRSAHPWIQTSIQRAAHQVGTGPLLSPQHIFADTVTAYQELYPLYPN